MGRKRAQESHLDIDGNVALDTGNTPRYKHTNRSVLSEIAMTLQAKSSMDGLTTREKLLDAAQAAMLAKGFAATSVEEICGAAGVTKGCFFHYFKSKEELAGATLDRFVEGMQQMFRDAPFRKETDPLKRVYGHVDLAIEKSQDPMARHGCLLGNFAQELSDTHEKIRAKCAQHFKEVVESLEQDMEEARKLHTPDSCVNAHSLAEHFVAVMQGALILSKSRKDPTVVKESLEHYKQYLNTVFGK